MLRSFVLLVAMSDSAAVLLFMAPTAPIDARRGTFLAARLTWEFLGRYSSGVQNVTARSQASVIRENPDID
jgi:hypothetical protein